jgi:hypothetical protein
MDDLKTYYQSFVPAANTVYKNNIGAGHAMVTDDYGGACSTTAAPYINNCGFDLAGEILTHLYGPLNPRNNGTLGGTFTEFNQSEFITGHGVAATGWIYVPQACTTASCRVHLVLHGCKQNYTDVSDQYVKQDRLQPLGRYQQHRAHLPADQHRGHQQLLGLVGLRQRQLREEVGSADGGAEGHGRPRDQRRRRLGAAGADRRGHLGRDRQQHEDHLDRRLGREPATTSTAAGSKVNAAPVAGTSYTDTGLAPSTTYSWTVAALDASKRVEGAMSAAASGTTLAGRAAAEPATPPATTRTLSPAAPTHLWGLHLCLRLGAEHGPVEHLRTPPR